jgi:hypothetical protein
MAADQSPVPVPGEQAAAFSLGQVSICIVRNQGNRSPSHSSFLKEGVFGFFYFFLYDIQHCFICCPSNSTMSEDAGLVPASDIQSCCLARSVDSTQLLLFPAFTVF